MLNDSAALGTASLEVAPIIDFTGERGRVCLTVDEFMGAVQ